MCPRALKADTATECSVSSGLSTAMTVHNCTELPLSRPHVGQLPLNSLHQAHVASGD